MIDTLSEADRRAAIEALNRVLEVELAGVVRYTHYSLMVYGYNRIPIGLLAQRQRQKTGSITRNGSES